MTNLTFRSLTASIVFLVVPIISKAEVLRSGFPLMMETVDSRLISLGGAALTEPGNSGSTLNNPAMLFNSRENASATFSRLPLEIWNGNLSLIQHWRQVDCGVVFQTNNFGNMNESVSGQGLTGKTFTASENLLGLAVAGDLLGYGSWGVGAKIDWQNIDGHHLAAFGLDAGVTIDPRWERVKIGVSIRNMGSELGSNKDHSTPTPTESSLAVSKKLAHLPLTIYAASHLRRSGEGDWDVDFLPGEPGLAFGAGGEFELIPGGADKPIFLRFGYRSIGQGLRVGNSADTFAGLTFGLGLSIRTLTFDYAFAPMGALGQIHRMGVSKVI